DGIRDDLVTGVQTCALPICFPQVHLKAFTMVEVGYLAQRTKISIRETLERLKDAGVDSLPGGGAEIFCDRVRRVICDHKLTGQRSEERRGGKGWEPRAGQAQ